MTDKHDRNYNLMEYFLNLLPILELNDMGMEQLLDRGAQLSAASLPDATNLWIAHEIMQFMDEMPGGFFIYRADGDEEIIYANKALLRIFQCKSLREFRDWTHNSFRGLVHPDDLDAVERSIQEQIADSQYDLDYVEYRILRKDGAVRWLEDYGHFIHTGSTGDFFYVFAADATEKRHQQLEEKSLLIQESQQKEEKLQSLIQEHKRERTLIDQEHLRRLEVIEGLSMNYETILYADLDADKILPYRLSARTEKQFENTLQMRSFQWYTNEYLNTWVHPEDRALMANATSPERIREQLASNKIFITNYRILSGDEIQYLQLRIVNVGSPSHISQVVMGYRRVDEEFRREMERNQMLEEALTNAKSAMVAKNTFLSNMSHDMRTPLNALFGYTALAKKHIKTPGAAMEYIEKIEASSHQLLELINKVLELSWVESDDATLEETECSLPDILNQVHTRLLPLAQEKAVAFSVDLLGLSQPNVYGDGARIAQLLQHLVHNAITYTQSGGKVELIARELEPLSNQYVNYQFLVKDSGSGIGREFLAHIYESFAREHNTTASGIHGTGLGLTITKNIVERMGGQITVDSEVSKGSTFTVTLPLRVQGLEASFSSTVPFPQLQNQKILLVEDNEINLEIEMELLQDLGFQIESAENGKCAVDRIAAAAPGEFSLILMDIQMPVMNGWEAARAIRALEDPALSAIPIIALSANAFESDKRTSQESGINAHLTKPFDVPLLLETIKNIL